VLFFLLAGGEFSPLVKTIAGYEGIVCGLSAVLTGLAEVANETYGEVVPLGKIKQH
jgi:succinate-acetate transporter protein